MVMSRVAGRETLRQRGASKVDFEIFVADAVLWLIRQSWPAGFELNLMSRFMVMCRVAGRETLRQRGASINCLQLEN